MSIPQAKVAIITVTYNSTDFIEEYLTSITPFISKDKNYLVIVDNASSDDTCAKVSAYAEAHNLSAKIHIEASQENLGFGKGCNKAVEIAEKHEPTHLWFLNPDTRIFNDSGEKLLSLLSSDTVDFAGSILVDEHMNPRPGAFRFPSILTTLLSTISLGVLDKIFHKHTKSLPIQKTSYQADWLTGASFMTELKCFQKLKGFDPFYFLYYEEVDLFYRAKKSGLSVWACPESKVFHISGASTGMNNRSKQAKRLPKYWFESRRYFYISNYGKFYFAALDITFLISHNLWKVRAKIQGKPIDTPPHIVKDTMLHSLFYKLLPVKNK